MERVEILNAVDFAVDDQLDALLQALPDGIVLVDTSGNIAFVNKRLEQLAQYHRDDLLGRPIEVLVPQSSRAVHEGHRLQFTGDPGLRPMGSGLEVRLRCRSGSEIPVDIQLSTIDVEAALFVVAAIRDIRERKAVEEALDRSEERLRMFVEAAPVMLFTSSPEGVTKSVNRAFETLTGWSREDWVGKHFAPMVHPEDLARIVTRIDQVAGGEAGAPQDVRILTRGGDYLSVESTVVPAMSDGKVVELLGVGRDVTEQRRAEALARGRLEQFRHIFRHAPIGLALVDVDGEITNANNALSRFLGWEREDLVGTRFQSFTHPDDADRDTELIRELSAGTIPNYQIERRYVTRDGRVAYGVTTVSHVGNELDDHRHSFHIVEDVTERKRLEREVSEFAKTAANVLSSLTPRETEVLHLLAGSESVGELAVRLSVSVRTVESHIANAYRKLGVRTREDAVSEFARWNAVIVGLQDRPFATDSIDT